MDRENANFGGRRRPAGEVREPVSPPIGEAENLRALSILTKSLAGRERSTHTR